MKVTYTQNRFEIDGVPVINPGVLPITAYVNSVLNLGSLVHNETQNVINDGDSFPLPDNIIAEKVNLKHSKYTDAELEGDRIPIGEIICALNKAYRLKLKEPLVDTGSKESIDIEAIVKSVSYNVELQSGETMSKTKEDILDANGFDFAAFEYENEYSAKNLLIAMEEHSSQQLSEYKEKLKAAVDQMYVGPIGRNIKRLIDKDL